MKKLILTLMLLAMTASSFAGIIQNRKTGETLEFVANRQDRSLEIISFSANVASKTISLGQLKEGGKTTSLYGMTVGACDAMFRTLGECLLIPVVFIPGLAVATLDTLLLPIRLPVKFIQKSRNKKDFQILMTAITSTDVKLVGEKRFRRIEKLLQ